MNVALVGLGFGKEFAPIYVADSRVNNLYICDTNISLCEKIKNELGDKVIIADSFDAILSNKDIDAVHLVTPIPLHAKMSVAVLNSGKHCASTVPMATSIKELKEIVKATKRSGKNFMLMETSLYTYQMRYVEKLYKDGELGDIQFLRGSHYQDMEGWPSYWVGLPPMWYSSHAVAPLVKLAGSPIISVSCLGSGKMNEEKSSHYNNPYPIETALFKFKNSNIVAEATRSLFDTAKVYQEGLYVYGSKKTFEWGLRDFDNPNVTTMISHGDLTHGSDIQSEEIKTPNIYDELPLELRSFTISNSYIKNISEKELQKTRPEAHHGSHPFLVNEFISSILENRQPKIDVYMGANITAAGLLAHKSAMHKGKEYKVPSFK